jgi:hypothetical protein
VAGYLKEEKNMFTFALPLWIASLPSKETRKLSPSGNVLHLF